MEMSAMEPKERPRRYEYFAHQLTRLLRESDDPNTALCDLIEALCVAGVTVLGAERTGELFRDALADLGKPS